MSLEWPSTSAAVAMRLPPFWPTDPEVWFIQVEGQFSRRSITASRTKYEEIIGALPMEYATEVRDLLVNPPEENPYEKLKEKLISRIADSAPQNGRTWGPQTHPVASQNATTAERKTHRQFTFKRTIFATAPS